MAKMKKKKKERDFHKVKIKVGRKLPKSNETNTSFKSKKLVILEQFKSVDSKDGEQDPVPRTHRKLTLQSLLDQLNHHNVSRRFDAVQGIRELLRQSLSDASLPLLSSRVARLLVDSDFNIRKAAVDAILTIMDQSKQPSSSSNDISSPHFSSMMSHMKCALSHTDVRIQLNSLPLLCGSWKARNVDILSLITHVVGIVSKLGSHNNSSGLSARALAKANKDSLTTLLHLLSIVRISSDEISQKQQKEHSVKYHICNQFSIANDAVINSITDTNTDSDTLIITTVDSVLGVLFKLYQTVNIMNITTMYEYEKCVTLVHCVKLALQLLANIEDAGNIDKLELYSKHRQQINTVIDKNHFPLPTTVISNNNYNGRSGGESMGKKRKRQRKQESDIQQCQQEISSTSINLHICHIITTLTSLSWPVSVETYDTMIHYLQHIMQSGGANIEQLSSIDGKMDVLQLLRCICLQLSAKTADTPGAVVSKFVSGDKLMQQQQLLKLDENRNNNQMKRKRKYFKGGQGRKKSNEDLGNNEVSVLAIQQTCIKLLCDYLKDMLTAEILKKEPKRDKQIINFLHDILSDAGEQVVCFELCWLKEVAKILFQAVLSMAIGREKDGDTTVAVNDSHHLAAKPSSACHKPGLPYLRVLLMLCHKHGDDLLRDVTVNDIQRFISLITAATSSASGTRSSSDDTVMLCSLLYYVPVYQESCDVYQYLCQQMINNRPDTNVAGNNTENNSSDILANDASETNVIATESDAIMFGSYAQLNISAGIRGGAFLLSVVSDRFMQHLVKRLEQLQGNDTVSQLPPELLQHISQYMSFIVTIAFGGPQKSATSQEWLAVSQQQLDDRIMLQKSTIDVLSHMIHSENTVVGTSQFIQSALYKYLEVSLRDATPSSDVMGILATCGRCMLLRIMCSSASVESTDNTPQVDDMACKVSDSVFAALWHIEHHGNTGTTQTTAHIPPDALDISILRQHVWLCWKQCLQYLPRSAARTQIVESCLREMVTCESVDDVRVCTKIIVCYIQQLSDDGTSHPHLHPGVGLERAAAANAEALNKFGTKLTQCQWWSDYLYAVEQAQQCDG